MTLSAKLLKSLEQTVEEERAELSKDLDVKLVDINSELHRLHRRRNCIQSIRARVSAGQISPLVAKAELTDLARKGIL